MKKLIGTLFTIAMVISFSAPADAVSSYKSQFNTRYGTTGTVLDSCTLCHTGSPSGSNVNVYGTAFLNSGFAAIENLDSDGDGFTNIAEITARTFPGNAASKPATTGDTTAPTVSAFAIPATASSLTVTITTFTATDAVGVTGYKITESSTAPTSGSSGWTGTAPANYTFASAGAKTLYAWAKDAAGNVSTSRNASVTITLPDTTAPTVSAFAIPATASSLTVAITTFTATDAVGVTGYKITESATAPTSGSSGWTGTVPANYTFASAGAKTLYAWAKDAAGNVSTSRNASVTITLPAADTTKPVVSAFTLPATANSLTVSISSLVASDNVGVTGYMVTESAGAPASGAAGWTGTAPADYTFSSAGAKTLYAWAKDAAGNVSTGMSASVTITIVPAPAAIATDIGFFINGIWKIDTNGDTVFTRLSDAKYIFGTAGQTAVTGRWTAGGINKVGTFYAGKWKLDLNGDGIFDPATEKFTFGVLGDKPIVGDWDGDGIDEIGVYRNGKFILDLNGNRVLDQAEIDGAVAFGMTGGKPVSGNWTGTGVMVGVFKSGTWYLDMNGDGVFDQADDASFTFGVPGDMPIIGDWDGDGIADIGVYRPTVSKWLLDMDGNHSFDPAVDMKFTLGTLGAQPVVAK